MKLKKFLRKATEFTFFSILPVARKPFLSLITIIGIACGTAFFFSMLSANYQAKLSMKPSSIFDKYSTKDNNIKPIYYKPQNDKIPVETLRSCQKFSHMGITCIGKTSFTWNHSNNKKVNVIVIDGSFFESLMPVWSTNFFSSFEKGIKIKDKIISPIATFQNDENFMIIPTPLAQTLFDLFSGFDQIEISANVDYYKNQLEFEKKVSEIPLKDKSLVRFYPEKQYIKMQNMTLSYRINLMILAFISMLVASIFLYNISRLQIIEKKNKIGILRQIGANRKLIFKSIILEQIFLGSTGGLLGAYLGEYLTSYLTTQVLNTINDLYGNINPIEKFNFPYLYPLSVAFGAVFFTVSSIFHTYYLIKIDPEDLRKRNQAIDLKTNTRIGIFIVCIFFIFLAKYVPPFSLNIFENMTNKKSMPWFAYISSGLIFFAIFAVSPLLIRFINIILSYLIDKFNFSSYNGPLRLSIKRLNGLGLKVHTGVATLSCSLSLAVGISIMVLCFKNQLLGWYDQVFSSELVAYPKTLIKNETTPRVSEVFISKLKKEESVKNIDCQLQHTVNYKGYDITLYGVEYGLPLNYPPPIKVKERLFTDLNFDEFYKKFSNSKKPLILATEAFMYKNNLSLGDSISININQTAYNFKIAARVIDFSTELGYLIIPRDKFTKTTKKQGCQGLRIYTNIENKKNFISSLSKADEIENKLSISSNKELKNIVFQQFDQTFELTFVMTILAIILGGFALIVQTAHTAKERITEWNTLKRIGLSNKGLLVTMFYDNLIIILCSSFMALIFGNILGWILTEIINKQSFGWTINYLPKISFINTIKQVFFSVIALLPITTIVNYVVVKKTLIQGLVRE